MTTRPPRRIDWLRVAAWTVVIASALIVAAVGYVILVMALALFGSVRPG